MKIYGNVLVEKIVDGITSVFHYLLAVRQSFFVLSERLHSSAMDLSALCVLISTLLDSSMTKVNFFSL